MTAGERRNQLRGLAFCLLWFIGLGLFTAYPVLASLFFSFCDYSVLHPPAWAKPALVLMGLWGVGNSMVIYLAGLQDVPKELYEAAELDGASWWRRIWHVTLPMISPVIYFNLIMGIIGSLQVFTQAFIMT